jgi:hypothetical protein
VKINTNGQYQTTHQFNASSRFGLNFYKNGNELLLNSPHFLYTIVNGKVTDSTSRSLTVKKKSYWNDSIELLNINHEGMLFANKPVYYKKYGQCIVNLVQYDESNYTFGFIEIIALKDKQIVERFKLPSRSEMQPRIEDFNNDGFPDLLINCNDGNLYCYDISHPKN